MLAPSPGIYRNVPFKDYCEWEAMNFSKLKSMADSPKQFKYDLGHQREDTPSFKVGRAMHAFTLEPALIDKYYVVAPLFNTIKGEIATNQKATKEFKAFVKEAEANGKEVLTIEERQQAQDMATTCLEIDTDMLQYLRDGYSELSAVWIDPITGILCKCRADHVQGFAMLDLKSTKDASLKKFKWAIKDYFYHVQGAFYSWGLEEGSKQSKDPKQELITINTFHIYAVESFPPYDGDLFRIHAQSLCDGGDLFRAWLDDLKKCQDSGIWPGKWRTGQKVVNVSESYEFEFTGGTDE